MKKLLPLLCWALAPIVASSALAQTGDGYVGIYRDSLGTQACTSVPQYTGTTLYVIAKTAGQSADGVTGAEFRIEVTNPSGWYLSYTPPGTASIVMGNPIDTDPNPNAGGGLNLGFPSCQLPSGSGLVRCGTLSVFNAGGGPTNLLVKRHSQPTNPGFACALFVRCDDPYYTKVCMTPAPPDSCTLGTQKVLRGAADDPTISTASLNDAGNPDGGEDEIPPERQVLASFRRGIIELPQGQTKASRAQTTISSPEIAAVVDAYGVETIEKAFPNFNLADTLGISRTGEVVRLANLSEIYALTVPVGGNTLGLATDLTPLDGVGYAEQNGTVQPATTTCTYDPPCPLTILNCPDDPSFMAQQWNLVNGGQGGGECGADIGTHEAWAKLRELGDSRPGSSGIKIAILDWGIDAGHEEMTGRVSGDAGWSDRWPDHRTHVAGIAAANTDNGRGIAGVDWEAQLISRRIDGVNGNFQQLADIVRNAANDSNPSLRAHVLNSSWAISLGGNPVYSSTLRLAFRDVYMLDRVQTVAMGNAGPGHSRRTVWYPAAFGQGQINVGAMNQYNLDYSLSCIGDHIDVAAPGENIYSSVPGNNYTIISGTSQAAPHVAGLASLLLAVKPWLHADDVRELIRLTATDMIPLPGTEGEDIYTGTGRIDAGEAVSKLLYPSELRHEEAIGGDLGNEDWVGDMKFSYPPPGLDSETFYEAHRFLVERDVSFPPVFESIEAVWGRGTHTIGYSTDGSTSGFPPINYGMGWCEPVPGTITLSGCRLRTYVYLIYHDGNLVWAPTMAGSVKFAYSVLGEATVSDVERDEEPPSSGFALVNDNPFTGAGAFKLKLSRTAEVAMDLFDVAGRKVKSLYEGQFSPGQHELPWDARNEQGRRMPAGLYFARVRVGDAHLVRKIVLMP